MQGDSSMERSKNQAVYRFLPDVWISEKDEESGHAVTARIKNWNYVKMDGIYDSFIQSEIKRQIRLFANRGGDISSFDITPEANSLLIVEARSNEGIPDIIGEKSPLVFYCSSCGLAFELKNANQIDKYTWKCKNPHCQKWNVKQLQMIYTCECGFAQPIHLPRMTNIKEYWYRPTEETYKMYYKSANGERLADLHTTCPTCSARLVPDNAISGRNYKAFTLKLINLVDDKSGKFYEKGLEAQKTIVARWFDKVPNEEFNDVLDHIELAFSDEFRSDAQRKQAEAQAKALVAQGIIPEALFESTVASLLGGESNSRSIEKYVHICDDIFIKRKAKDEDSYNEWINHFSFKLMQYNTLKFADAKRTITLEDSINRQLEMEFIESPEDIYSLNNKMGIANMQVSSDIQIVNCTYGYSRKTADPSKVARACRLKLNSFERSKDGSANLVYGAKLDTEGILFEIDQAKIIQWLYRNHIIELEQMPDLEDSLSVKKWFSEYVHSDVISMFGEIDDSEIITKYVFALLHSMSHAFINTAGELSGLSSNSLAEIIIVETASIFIYAQTSQGIPLGALSGMAETNYSLFLRKTYDESRHCIFDPICEERDNSACSACLIIPEISCNHFNSGLGRKYLYSLGENENTTTGFWEM